MVRGPATETLAAARGSLVEQILVEIEAGRRPDADALARQFPETPAEIQHLIAVVELIRGTGGRHTAATQDRAFGDFRILREIGRGGMGVVYEARQLSLDRRVALKVLLPGVSVDSIAIERFVREARAAGGLQHKHIVPIFATGTHNDLPYYAMQFIEGDSLAAWRDEATAMPDEARARQVATWGVQIADALAHAHAAGIVHRDIKPSNLLRDAGDHVWVTDFGLAWRTNEASLTMTGDVLGTVRYMSPEQARGGGRVDARSDVYSLGATLYELVAGRPPFVAADYEATLKQVLLDDPPSLTRGERAIPLPLSQVIHRAMAKDPADRYPDARVLAEELQRCLDDRPLRYRPPGLFGELIRFARRNRLLSALAASAALLTVVFAVGMSVLYARADRHAASAIARRDAAREARAAAAVARTAAESREQEARQVQRLLQDMLASVDPEIAQARDTGLLRGILRDAADRLDQLDDQPVVAAALHETIGRTFARIGAFADAQRHLDAAEQLLIDAPDPLVSLAVQRARADLWHASGQFGAAEEAYAIVVSDAVALGADELAAEARTTLAELLLELDREEVAAVLLDEVLAGEAGDEALHLRARWLEATLAHYRGDPDGAARACRALLVEIQDEVGAGHPLVGHVMRSLLVALRDLEAFDEAETLGRDLIERLERLHGADAIETLVARHITVGMQIRRDNPAAAVEELAALVPRFRAVAGDRHPATLAVIHDLGLACREIDQHERGEALLREALEGCRAVLDTRHRLTRSTLANLVTLLHIQGRLRETVPLYRELYALEAEARAGLDEDALTLLHNFCFVLIRFAQHEDARDDLAARDAWLDEAEPIARENLALRIRAYGEDDPRTHFVRDHLGLILELRDRPDLAEPLFRAVLEGHRRQRGADDMLTVVALTRYADCLGQLERFDEALTLQQQASAALAGVLHPRDIRWAMLNSNLGWFLLELGRYDEAETHLRKAYDQIAERYGRDAADIAVTRARLIAVYDRSGQDEAAAALRAEAEQHDELE